MLETRRRGTGSTAREEQGRVMQYAELQKLLETGEPCALKGASTVWGGEVRKGQGTSW